MIALPPSLDGAVHFTCAEVESASAETPVGAAGATAPVGVTELDCADSGLAPPGLAARTVNRYAVPGVRPLTVVLVAGGFPVIVFDGWAAEPMYGVTSYEATGPPLDGAVHDTFAEAWPAVALTPVTWPGAGAVWNITSTA